MVKSSDDIKRTFSQVHNDLAEYYNARASESWSNKAISESGEYLEEAAGALEKAWEWSGHQMEAGANAAVHSARDMGENIAKGAKWVSAEVKEAVDNLETEITIQE
jgi:hypothetical protein